MEIYRGHLIAYSLGNFSAWNTFALSGASQISGVLHTTLAADGTVSEIQLDPVVLELAVSWNSVTNVAHG